MCVCVCVCVCVCDCVCMHVCVCVCMHVCVCSQASGSQAMLTLVLSFAFLSFALLSLVVEQQFGVDLFHISMISDVKVQC